MPPPADTERYKNHRFPGEIISHGVWLYQIPSDSYATKTPLYRSRRKKVP